MAHVSQEDKARFNAALKLIMPKEYKWSLRVRHHSTLILTIQRAPVDLVGIAQANDYARGESGWVTFMHDRFDKAFKGHPDLVELFGKIQAALNNGNHNNSDIMTDYFDVGWYTEISIGTYDKPFVFTAKANA